MEKIRIRISYLTLNCIRPSVFVIIVFSVCVKHMSAAKMFAYETYGFVRIAQIIRIESFICIYLYSRRMDIGVPALRLQQNGDITRKIEKRIKIAGERNTG